MGFQFNNTAKVDGLIENEAYVYFWQYYFTSSVYPCPEGFRE